ncbi:phospholipase [Kaistella flava (ex Peng et al. 2021)]|uniref:Phospholipase n=1 Tax=Kaistella flava (ex Peng et al. 2021) TaxID=2038776 RepID=A0A7M2Y9T5_9FLAO|nr:dienelactone hydrolase family protein [Kaistella flava (ex Peng et al. 2021)]QOW10113.1 phospholipase [Kaistella flava (ex Peng et al. 2021)]
MYKKIRTIITFLFFTTSFFSHAQTQLFDNIKVDSLTFVKNRNSINNLSNDFFEKHVYTEDEGEIPYRLLLPQNYNREQNYPVIIAFHNSSRIGNDNEKQLEPLSKIWIREEIYNKYHAFVIVPQFNERSSNYTKDKNEILVSKPFNDIHLIFGLLEKFQKEYKIDKSRIYLVGYSMGASTAQNLISISTNKFAAIVSVAAVPDFSNSKALRNKNIFLIHGEKDTENPYEGSLKLFEKLKGNKNLVFKTYNELNHGNITIPLLLNDEIPNWLFKQKK